MALEATYRQEGETINFANTGSAIKYGDVIPYGGGIVVAAEAIAATSGNGNVYATGVFQMAAVTNAAFAVGDLLYWDNSGKVLQKVTTAYFAGVCVLAKAQSTATAEVKIGLLPVTVANAIEGLTAGLKIKGGITSVTGVTGGVIATGLTTVTTVVAILGADAAATGTIVSGKPSATPGSIELSVWKPTAADNSAPILSVTAVNVNWIAYGT